MERLTVDTSIVFCDIAQCECPPGGVYCPDGYCDQRRCYEKLREYERTGHTPQECAVAFSEIEQLARDLQAQTEHGEHLAERLAATQRLLAKSKSELTAYRAGIEFAMLHK